MCPCVLRVARHTLAVGITSPVPAPAGAAICCQFAAYWAKIPKSQRSSAHLKMNMLCKVTNRYNRHNRYELEPAGPERSRRKPLGAGASLNCPGPVITQHARRWQRKARTTRASARRAIRTPYRREHPACCTLSAKAGGRGGGNRRYELLARPAASSTPCAPPIAVLLPSLAISEQAWHSSCPSLPGPGARPHALQTGARSTCSTDLKHAAGHVQVVRTAAV
jgi:hypothetical protein